MATADIEWGDGWSGGSIAVTPTGVSVHNNCHSCTSVRLTSTRKILELHTALGDLLREREVAQ